MDFDWNTQLVDQLDWHWQNHLRPRFDAMTVEEYFWEPVAGCWSVRRHPDAGYFFEHEWPPPSAPPVTTIAWRLGHLIVGVFGQRNAGHFGGPPCEVDTFAYAGTPGEALERLDEAYAMWTTGVRSLGEDGIFDPCGPSEGPFAEFPMAALVLHINREAIHHGAEVLLLRDLYRNRG